ncbi:MAG: hypothetical protein K2Y56_22550 [Methylobacterium sp.]|uniref:hypothetical protein n=1 Tax=Methylobacterium sp. TaxID=409 RepID=UPI0025EDBB17|nr:hypothetical protein [Methylobacterium sp.]MBX9934261.1 hypothetical protein [Methylobacterium sp.]
MALTATALASPALGFPLVLGLASGLGALFAIAGSWGEPGMEVVGLQLGGLMAIAAVMTLCFVSQARAILQASNAWRRS